MKVVLYIIIFSFFYLNGQTIIAQQTTSTVLEKPSKLQIESFAYPLFFGNEQHTSFKINYLFNSNLQANINVFYDTYALSNRLRTSFNLQKNISEKLYIFGGLELEQRIAVNKQINGSLTRNRYSANTGFGYHVKENLTLEAKANFGLNKSAIGAFGEPSIETPKIFTLNSNWKF